MNDYKTFAVGVCLGACSLCAAAVDVPSNQEAVVLPSVEVTGTRLKRADIETSSPVDVITREEIQSAGFQTLSDAVRSLTADNNGSIGLGNVSGFAMGSTAVALRGLAVNATLVLINGRRTASYGLADDSQRTFVNLSAIPLDVVERIEVLKDGGSAIYGSDAIAGVVNIILRDRFEGLSGNVSYGTTQYGDGEAPRGTFTGGLGNYASDGYNVFFNIEASGKDAILASNRGGRKWIGNGDLRPYGYDITAGGSGPNIGGWFDNATGSSNANRFGAVSPATGAVTWQQLPGCNSTISLSTGLGGCAFDRVKESGVIEPDEDKLNIYLRGAMRVSKQFQPYTEFGMFRSDTKSIWVFGATSANESWVNPSTDSVASNAALILPAAHPDNPLGTNALLSYLVSDAGQRTFEHDSITYRALVGANGKLGAWDYDTGLLYAHNNTQRTVTGFIRDSVLKAGLNGTGPFGFYRLGANAGLNSAAFYRALSPELSTDNTASLLLVDFKAARDLYHLRGGPLGLSLGAEYRRETLDAPAMPLTDIGDIVGWSYYVYGGEQKTASMFVEINAPVFKHLDFDAAMRVDKVWGFDTSVTPKFGFKWRPLELLAIRGTYSEGFRAPNPAEKGSNSQNAFTLSLTPGNPSFLGIGRNTSNPNIQPEESQMVTLGAIFEPSSSTSLGINFWWLKRSNEINSLDPFAVVANPAGFPNATIVRDGAGNVLEVTGSFENNSESQLQGIDFDLNHHFTFEHWGTFTAQLNWAYLDSYKKTFTGGTAFEYAGTHGPIVVSGNTGSPQNKGTFLLGWERGPMSVATYVNFIDSYLNKDHVGGPCLSFFADGREAPGGCEVDSLTTVDLQGGYRPRQNLRLYFSVTNIFDSIAPLDPSSYINLNFNPAFHVDGAIGRTFNVGLRYDF